MKTTAFIILLLSVFLLLSGCCPKTRIMLLDSDKQSTAIVVSTEKGQQILDQPNTYTEIGSASAMPTKPKVVTPQELEKNYGALLQAAPNAPVHFLLYFKPGSAEMTDQSQNMFPEIEQAIRDRLPCDVNIIGHTDSTGSKAYNIQLSLHRAEAVRAWITTLDLPISHISVESYGEEDPLIPTADDVAEPQNRRVEILIR